MAQEQAQDSLNRRFPVDYGSRVPDTNQYPSVTRQTFPGEAQRKERSMFLPDRTRTLRAKEEHTAFFRPRMFYDTYTKRQHMEDYAYQDVYERRPPSLRRRHSTRSLGHCSEGSLQLLSGPHSSGFEHKSFMPADTAGRSYSLSSLARYQSTASLDQLSTGCLPQSLVTEGNRGFMRRNSHHHPKRPPLSSIVWNTPPSPEHPPYPDGIFRTQSLMEFGSTFEDAHPCSLQENIQYEFFRAKVNYRRVAPNISYSNRVSYGNKLTGPPCFDSRENYALHRPERNTSRRWNRYPSVSERMNLSYKSFPFERTENQPIRPDSQQYYRDESCLPSDVGFERIPVNANDWQSGYTKSTGMQQRGQKAPCHLSGYMRSNDPSEDFAKTASVFNEPDLSRSSNEAEHAIQGQNVFIRTGQTSSQFLVTRNKDLKEGASRAGLERVNVNSSKASWVSSPKNSSAPGPQTRNSCKPFLSFGSKRQARRPSARDIEKLYLSKLRNGNEQGNEGECAADSDLDQTPPLRLAGVSRRSSILQSWQQRGRPLESMGTYGHTKKFDNIYSVDRSLDVLEHDDLPGPYTEKFNRHNSFVRRASSSSVTGSLDNSPSKSPAKYYTLPRKSASIDGSITSEKPISSPTVQVPFKNKIAMRDNLETLVSNRASLNQGNKMSTLYPSHSSWNPTPQDVTCKENIPQSKDSHSLIIQDPKHSIGTAAMIASKAEKSTVSCGPDQTETLVLSDYEETDNTDSLHKYKTTSTLTVSIEEDNVQYHELISVYYTLPRRHSRTLCNLFQDDTKNVDSSPASPPPSKKYEVRIGLATVNFPSNLEKDSPQKTPATPDMPPNSKIPDESNKESPDAASPVCPSQNMVYKQDETLASQTGDPALVPPSNGVAPNDPPSDLEPTAAMNGSVNSINDAACSQYVDTCPSLKEGSKIDTPLSLGLPNPTKPSGHLAAASVNAKRAQEENPQCYQPPIEATAGNNPCLPPSHSTGNNQEGKYAANLATGTAMNAAEEKMRQDAVVKDRARYICHIIALHSKKGNGLQPRNKSVKIGTEEELISETNGHADSQNQTFPVDAASTIDSAAQPNILNKSPLDCQTEQEQLLQNSSIDKTCRHSQRCPNQFPSANQELLDYSADENKQALDCTKDKTSDIEKRKNRPSIKNKLAAMYKTSRKFSSKKSSSPRPHISNIFSQNDAPSSEVGEPGNILISPVPRSFAQKGNENQNRNPLPAEFEDAALDESGNCMTESCPLMIHEIRRPFTNLCNQKRETQTPRQNDKMEANSQYFKACFPKEIVPTLNKNSQVHVEGLKNSNHAVSSISVAEVNQKRKAVGNVDESLFFPLPYNKNSNILTKNYSKANICPPQKVISPAECDRDQNSNQSNRLRNLNLSYIEPLKNPSTSQRERHLSENAYTQEPQDRIASGSNSLHRNDRYSRKFKSFSELLSCDENENWEPYAGSNRTISSRHFMYPSIEFGIFGKEQQQAFLDNIKRSLTEGRLWSPCLLKNPGFLRKEEGGSVNKAEPLSSEHLVSVEGASPNEQHVDPPFHGENPVDCSDSDSDTTTDDEYYLNEDDKESEL